jgi:hypothetical protein
MARLPDRMKTHYKLLNRIHLKQCASESYQGLSCNAFAKAHIAAHSCGPATDKQLTRQTLSDSPQRSPEVKQTSDPFGSNMLRNGI